MKYTAILNDKERELEITRKGDHQYKVIVDGNTHEVDARHCSPDLLSVLVDNVSHDISFSFDENNVHLNFRNRHFNIEVLDERRMRMRGVRSDLDLSGPEIIKTSMPGKVVKVLVEEGQEVVITLISVVILLICIREYRNFSPNNVFSYSCFLSKNPMSL